MYFQYCVLPSHFSSIEFELNAINFHINLNEFEFNLGIQVKFDSIQVAGNVIQYLKLNFHKINSFYSSFHYH